MSGLRCGIRRFDARVTLVRCAGEDSRISVQMAIRIILFASAALLLGAHFLRAGNLLLVALCVGSPLLFLYRSRWSLIVLQILAYCGTGIWAVTTFRLIEAREMSGLPWTVAAAILGGVALLTLLAGLLLNSRSIKERYPR
jgi:hypothetical protein